MNRSFRRSIQIAFGLLSAVLLINLGVAKTSAQDATPAQIEFNALPQIVISATDYHFELPDQAEAGLVAVTLQNNGSVPHHAAILKLNNGVTIAAIQQAFQTGLEALGPLVTFAGGPGTVLPGSSQRVALNLAPGQYVVVCFLPGPDGMSHAAMGMVAPLNVVAATADPMQAPATDATITLKDFAFDLPAGMLAGSHVWQVNNQGPEPHELSIFKLSAPMNPDQLKAALAAVTSGAPFAPQPGPPPIVPLGGLEPILSGGTALLELNLQPGDYVAVCFVPDPNTGKRHVELGMVMPFKVGA